MWYQPYGQRSFSLLTVIDIIVITELEPVHSMRCSGLAGHWGVPQYPWYAIRCALRRTTGFPNLQPASRCGEEAFVAMLEWHHSGRSAHLLILTACSTVRLTHYCRHRCWAPWQRCDRVSTNEENCCCAITHQIYSPRIAHIFFLIGEQSTATSLRRGAPQRLYAMRFV